MKKILAIVLAVVMLLPVFAVNSFAADKEVAVKLSSVNGDAAKGFAATDNSVSFTGERITFKLPNAVKKGETIKVHVTAKADGLFRSFLSDAAIKGSNWNQSAAVFFTSTMRDDNGNIDTIVEYTADADAEYILFAMPSPWSSNPESDYANEVTIYSVAVIVPASAEETVLFSVSKRAIVDPWGDGFIIKSDSIGKFVSACQKEGAEFRLVYSVTKQTWCNFNLNGNSNTYVEGEDGKRTGLSASVSGIDMTPGENKELKMTGAELLKFFTDTEGKEYGGAWPNGENKGDPMRGFDDVNNMDSLQIQPGEGNIFTVESLQVVIPGGAETMLVRKDIYKMKTTGGQEFNDKELPVDLEQGGWTRLSTNWVNGDMYNKIIEALNNPEATLEITYTGTIKQFVIQTEKGGAESIDLAPKDVNGKNVATIPCADIVKAMPFGTANKDVGWGNISLAECDNAKLESFAIYVIEEVPVNAKKVPGYKGCIYVDEQYHAYLIGGHFIVVSHEDNGFGRCGACFYEIPAVEEDGVPQDKVVYDMTATQGQDIEASLADGVVLADNQENENNCRIATNWVGGGKVWGDVTRAIADNADAYVKIVYTGTVDKFMFQSENGGYEEVAVEASNVEDDKNVAFISCADIIAASPVALGGNFGGWANMMLHYEGETTLYSFSVIVPAPVTLPDEEVIEVVDPTEANTTDEEDETPDNAEVVEQPEDKNPPTGIALAVLPMIVAAAACVASKRK